MSNRFRRLQLYFLLGLGLPHPLVVLVLRRMAEESLTVVQCYQFVTALLEQNDWLVEQKPSEHLPGHHFFGSQGIDLIHFGFWQPARGQDFEFYFAGLRRQRHYFSPAQCKFTVSLAWNPSWRTKLGIAQFWTEIVESLSPLQS